MFMPSSMTWMWPSPSLSGRPTSATDRLKFDTWIDTGMSVLVTVSPALGERTVRDGLAWANACGTRTTPMESASALRPVTKRRIVSSSSRLIAAFGDRCGIHSPTAEPVAPLSLLGDVESVSALTDRQTGVVIHSLAAHRVVWLYGRAGL